MKFETVRWLFPVAVTIHNFEEAVAFPSWSQTTTGWLHPVESEEFSFAVTILTLLAYLVTGFSVRGGKHHWATYLLVGYAFAMLVNIFVPHLLATVLFQQYMPGLATGLLLNLPIMVSLLHGAIQEGFVDWKTSIWVSLGVTITLVVALPILFNTGRTLASSFLLPNPCRI